MRELFVLHGPKLFTLDENHGARFAVQGDELHFERGAVPMYVHDCADISGSQMLLWQIRGQDDAVMLAEGAHVPTADVP